MNETRRLAILADGMLDFHHGKTATSIIRYRPDEVVAVIDSDHAGTTTEVVLGLVGDIPIVESIEEAFRFGPNALLIGIAPRGGGLPEAWRRQIVDAIEHGLDVISGLHYMLNEDMEFAAAASRNGVRLVDVRRPPDDLEVASMAPRRSGISRRRRRRFSARRHRDPNRCRDVQRRLSWRARLEPRRHRRRRAPGSRRRQGWPMACGRTS